ncbi:MAG: DUF5671 domain-containing protein [Acidimicrobiia bacterium]
MTPIISLVLLLAVIAGVGLLISRLWHRRPDQPDQQGVDILPYLILALAVGVATFSLARLARAGLAGDRLAGENTNEIAAALAGMVVAAPVSFVLWRRQLGRRKLHPRLPGWPVYLALIEVVFLTAFFSSVNQVARAMFGDGGTNPWTNLIVYGGVVAFHWWAAWREPPAGDASELPRLIGSGVALIALAIGLAGVLGWLLEWVYDQGFVEESLNARSGDDALVALALLVTGAPIWAWRWLPAWDEEPSVLRSVYLAAVSVFSLATALGTGIAIVAQALGYAFSSTVDAADHFESLPTTLSILLVALAIWVHHRRRMGRNRNRAVIGYGYSMAAIGLGALVGGGTALVTTVWDTPLAGDPTRQGLIALGLTVLVAGSVWRFFWRAAQQHRLGELRALQRRVYLIGMAFILGLTAAGALIAVLVVAFQTVLGEGEQSTSSLPTSISLTVLAGIATWHLLTVLRADGPRDVTPAGAPFSVTVICSHPGPLATVFPKEARIRVHYRTDGVGVVDEAMAGQIVEAVGGRPSYVWVDQDGFRTAPVRGD